MPESIDPNNPGDQTPAGDPNPQNPTDGTVTPVADPAPAPAQQVDQGKITRLEQERAGYQKVFKALNLDLDGDFVEKFNSGLITDEDIRNQIISNPTQPVAAPQSVDPAMKLDQIINRVQSQGASQEDFVDGLNAMKQYISETNSAAQQETAAQTMQRCIDTASSAIDADELHGTLNEELQAIEKQLFVAAVADSVARDAYQTEDPSRYYQPQVFESYAGRSAETLNKLRDAWINIGMQRAANPGQPAPTGAPVTPINPISPSAGGSIPPQQRVRYNLETLSKAAHAYTQQAATV